MGINERYHIMVKYLFSVKIWFLLMIHFSMLSMITLSNFSSFPFFRHAYFEKYVNFLVSLQHFLKHVQLVSQVISPQSVFTTYQVGTVTHLRPRWPRVDRRAPEC